MGNIREQLSSKFPFMKEKVGRIIDPQYDFTRVVQENNNPRTLLLLCGVEGCGKTTFAKKYLSGYTVINLDDILITYLKTHNFQGTVKENEYLNQLFFNQAVRSLKKGITILDCANHDIVFRAHTLDKLKNHYDKVIVFVFNPRFNTIINRINEQIELRARPNLLEDVSQQFTFFQYQISNHILEMGVDEVHFLHLPET